MNIRPKVSVIVTKFNCEKYVEACLSSFCNQTMDGLEIICVDDSSTDNTAALAESMLTRIKNSKFIILPKNSGPSYARNEALKYVTADYVMICDGDDFYDKDMCRAMYEKLSNEGVDLAVSQIRVEYDIPMPKKVKKADSRYYKLKFSGFADITNSLILKTDLSVCNKIFKKSILDAYNIRFPNDLFYEDAYFCMAYFFVSKRAYFINKEMYTYIRHANSIMTNTFSGNSGAKDHLFIAFKIYDFLIKNKLFEKYKQLYPIIISNCYKFAMRFSGRLSLNSINKACVNFINENNLLEKCPHPVLKCIVDGGAFNPNYTFAERIFSVKNSIDSRYRILTVLGIGIKLRRH